MKFGKVTGSVWATRKDACLSGQTFLIVEADGCEIVAADRVGAGTGDRVLVTLGSVASRYCENAPIDAAIVAIVDAKKE